MLIIAVFLNACDKDLDVPPQGQITQEELETNPNAASGLVTGIYNILWGAPFGPDVSNLQYIFVANVVSDDADKGSSPTDYAEAGDIDNLNPLTTNGIINNVWRGHYLAITRCNQALTTLQNAQFDESIKNALIGEARFLRGYFYFNMVRLFGGVVLIDRIPDPSEGNNPEFQTRATADDIYQFIIDDLTFAATNLPIKGATAAGRATKAAAQGLLAKVYLYRQDYQQAYAYADSVVTGKSGSYDLIPEYENLWREAGNNSAESIFEIQAGINASCSAAPSLWVVSQGARAGGKGGWPDLGFGFNSPSESLVNEYEPGDIRKDATIIFINPSPQGTVLWDGFRIPSQDSVANSRYNYKSYFSQSSEQNCGNRDFFPKHIPLLRLGEVLLIHAEAALQTGNSGAALTDVNRLRQRVGLTPLGSINLAAIWHERRVEMAMENDRGFDLVRQDAVQPGRAAAAFTAHGKTWQDRNKLLPIPQAQINLSGGLLTQNPGW